MRADPQQWDRIVDLVVSDNRCAMTNAELPEICLLEAGGAVTWYMAAPTGYMDHLFRTCPALQRESKGKVRKMETPVGDPYGWGVCGWCQRVYRARHKAAV